MVDFDNETTVATPAKDVMRIYLLQNKAFLEDSWRKFREADFSGVMSGLNKVRASLEQLYLIIEPIIGRHWKEEEFGYKAEEIKEKIEKGDKEEIRELIIKINRLLDKTKLTRLDTKFAKLNTWERSNRRHGY